MSPRKRWLLLALIPFIGSVVGGTAVQAQLAPAPDPSPLAPGDLKKPIFDTQTPVYDTTHAAEKSAGTVVAEVDGRTVTLGDVGDAIKELPASVSALPFAELYPSVLAKLVRQQALVIRAQQQALDEDPAVRRKVKAAGDQVMADALLHQEISRTITEQKLLDRYNKEIAGKPGPEEVHVRVIMVPTEDAATALIAELKAGTDFATLAKKSSLDTTASVGGDLGYARLDGLNPEVGAVAFSLQPSQFAPYPVHSAGSWFIVKVEDRKRVGTPTFAEVRGRLIQEMLREGVGDVVTKALADATVREYSINGKEVSSGGAN
ncbi:peptidylprolyl isomerase [Acidisphaera sp. S103]|uniref:peptidylprolyl isomerase n=1 Tax=Acidisphaera sp. S103 TaxID=1747223 RepID=UPI00131D4C32|nr:peptidylprolyl isomerase [Acidisphaera sp. S103]